MSNSVLEISPDSVVDLLIGVVLNVEECSLGFASTAVKHPVILSQRFLTVALKLVLILLFGGVVAEGEEGGMLHDPGGFESQREELLVILFHRQSVRLKSEVVSLLIELGDNLPLLTRVVNNGDLLIALESGRHSELELGLDLLGNGGQLVLVESDVGAVQRLQDHVAGERGWLRWVAIKHE